MLVNESQKTEKEKISVDGKKRKSLFWLLLSLLIFFAIIFSFFWGLVRSGLVYMPWMTEIFYHQAEASYKVIPVVNNINILNNIVSKPDHWELILSENQLTKLLADYLADDWQVIISDNAFEFYGSLFSAVNNEEQQIYAKIIYSNNNLNLFINDIKLARFISDYLLNKYLLKNDDGTLEEESFFDEILLKDKQIVLIGYGNLLDIAIDKIDSDQIIQTVLNYFLEEK